MIRSLPIPRLLILISILGALSGCTSNQTSSSSQTENKSETSQDNNSPASTATTNAPKKPVNSGDSTSTGNARTADEVMGDLDAELDASVAVFDGMILDERAKAEAAATRASGGLDASGGGDEDLDEVLFEEGELEEGLPGYGEFPEAVADADAEPGDETSEATATGEDSDGKEGASAPSSTIAGGIPEGVGDGRDDDIVARQIREAAQKEKDPALREKLWEEYRKYKNQQAGG